MYGNSETTSFANKDKVKVEDAWKTPDVSSTPEEHWFTFSTKTKW